MGSQQRDDRVSIICALNTVLRSQNPLGSNL
jgi:hypothetical protein